jgi:hypothetical protein
MGQGRVSHLQIKIAKTQGFTQVRPPPEGKDNFGVDYNGGDLKHWA